MTKDTQEFLDQLAKYLQWVKDHPEEVKKMIEEMKICKHSHTIHANMSGRIYCSDCGEQLRAPAVW